MENVKVGKQRSQTLMIIYLILFVTIVVVVFRGCSPKTKDVSTDPQYGNFVEIQGRWRIKAELYLIKTDFKSELFRLCTYESMKAGYGAISGVVSVGDEIEIEKLIRRDTFETTIFGVQGKIVSGKHAGKKVGFDSRLFVDDSIFGSTDPHGSIMWALKSEFFEKP